MPALSVMHSTTKVAAYVACGAVKVLNHYPFLVLKHPYLYQFCLSLNGAARSYHSVAVGTGTEVVTVVVKMALIQLLLFALNAQRERNEVAA